MAIEEENKDAIFQQIKTRFGDGQHSRGGNAHTDDLLRTFPSRVLWEFARDIGKLHCEKRQRLDASQLCSQASILRLLQNHEDIMFDLEGVIFTSENLPVLRYIHSHVMGAALTQQQYADPVFLQ